ncbi:hypothetical protein [Pseudoalteromonas aurantia]|uniref:Uncharacterized protein n=1 Tax=Pseudoalteromonas aurantia 208 TaxID=1314867 RepID=A0ABR9EHB0_9GAMM|nr:hypothetical protein [Pseudoalteromonas aurantia]MBE0370379.1 hypothetical protein [Pseudoalteromonas aurantia 208]
MWVVKKANEVTQYLITFKEVGLGSANFEITKMYENTTRKECPKSVDGFDQGQSNLFIKVCLGTPDYIDHNSDGRYVYLYHRPNGIALTYLFNKENKLTKLSVYQDYT